MAEDRKQPLPIIPGFRISGTLGLGGVGMVYEAIEEELGRTVALKTIPATGKWHRFQREMQALARLQHPGIVSIYTHGQTPDEYWYCMELVRGKSLKEVLRIRREGKSLPGAEEIRSIAALTSKVAAALARAHEKGVFHRDISPGNILVDEDGSPKLIDFGLAEVAGLSTITLTGSVFGTPPYLAPEVLRGRQEVDEGLCDLYALGVVLYEALADSHPYPHRNIEELFLRIQSSEPVSPRKANRSVPRSLEAVILRAIAREPQDRYASVKEFAADLESFLAGRPVEALHGSISTRLRQATRRGGIITLAIASALIFGAILGGAHLLHASREADRRSAATVERLKADLRIDNLEAAGEELALLREIGSVEAIRTAVGAMRLKKLALEYRGIDQECRVLASDSGSAGDKAKLAEKLGDLTRTRDEMFQAIQETTGIEAYFEP
jgi:serine/threonine protein kinase